MIKKIPNWLIIIVIVALLIASKFLFFTNAKSTGGNGNKGKDEAPVSVNYFVARASSYNNKVYATGKIGAMKQVDILPEVSGKVTAIYFKEGDHVEKGSILLKINDADLQAQLQKIKTQIKLAEQKMLRLKKLLDINGVSKEEFETQENELASLKADEAFVLAQIAKTTIAAPFSGSIGLKNISEGSFVSSNTPIVSLVQLKPIYVEFSVPEKYNSKFKKGVLIEFSNESTAAIHSYTAQVYAIEPKVDEITKTIMARALYTGSQTFYPGSFVHVNVTLGETNNALMVPTEAVISKLNGQKVFVCKNQVAVETIVEIGMRSENEIEILSGLSVGDTVITTGLMKIKKDSKIKLIKSQN